ncbi:MAG: zinc finger protein [Caldilineales bacterium]
MTKKTVGYVDLEWTCPQCSTRNLGTSKKCTACGAAQPAEVQFQVGAASATLLSDAEKIRQAQSGADVHCPYCGTRNPAGSPRCKLCGGDLEGGQARQAGQTVGALSDASTQPVTCKACGTANPATATQCRSCGAPLPGAASARPQPTAPTRGRLSPLVILLLAALLLIGCVLLFSIFSRGGDTGRSATQQVTGSVGTTAWKRVVLVQALMPVQRQDWQANIPGNVQLNDCEDRLYRTYDEPVANSVEVCGTPYVQDTGTGLGEVVQDCQYQVFAPYCHYTTTAWQNATPLVLEGSGLLAQWPQSSLGTQQREAGREESYTITFQTETGSVRYSTSSAQEFEQFSPGSRWLLEVDSRGRILAIQPAP